MYKTFEELTTGIEEIYRKGRGSKNETIAKLVQENLHLLDNHEKVFKVAEVVRNSSTRNIGFFQQISSKFSSNSVAEKLLNQYMHILAKRAENLLSDYSDSDVFKYNGFLMNTMDSNGRQLKPLLQAARKTSTELYLDYRLQTAGEEAARAQGSQKNLEDYERSVRDSWYSTVSTDALQFGGG